MLILRKKNSFTVTFLGFFLLQTLTNKILQFLQNRKKNRLDLSEWFWMIQCSKVAEIEDYAQNWWIQVIANVCKWGLFTKCKWIACTEFAREIQINNESGAGFRLMQTEHLFKFWVKPSEIIKKNHKLFGLEMNVVDYISFLFNFLFFNFLLFKLTGIFGFFHLASNLETAPGDLYYNSGTKCEHNLIFKKMIWIFYEKLFGASISYNLFCNNVTNSLFNKY